MMGAAYPIGFIGLGTMGEAMALTLVKAGTRLLVWNRTPAKAEILAAAGADVARVRRAFGTGPQIIVSRHIGVSSGRTSAMASASPASMATSWPASAGLRDPETGAST